MDVICIILLLFYVIWLSYELYKYEKCLYYLKDEFRTNFNYNILNRSDYKHYINKINEVLK